MKVTALGMFQRKLGLHAPLRCQLIWKSHLPCGRCVSNPRQSRGCMHFKWNSVVSPQRKFYTYLPALIRSRNESIEKIMRRTSSGSTSMGEMSKSCDITMFLWILLFNWPMMQCQQHKYYKCYKIRVTDLSSKSMNMV